MSKLLYVDSGYIQPYLSISFSLSLLLGFLLLPFNFSVKLIIHNSAPDEASQELFLLNLDLLHILTPILHFSSLSI
ncbi:hypothetical protein C8J55DRAFT_563700 [Lentinula edodes]|uniref:Uncharacterized protein n=1 Tax=Lentinula lateritia TaxID=40482 RepID=A0A9W9A0J6_9AGAR|nr:hypothetical protein C8J55DRAFT_563700 [Lentinula edodes]